jgi:hypothetical protein
VAKLIRSTSLTANRDEIDCAKASGEMWSVIQPFTHHTRHPAIISVVAISLVRAVSPNRPEAIEVNRPYLFSQSAVIVATALWAVSTIVNSSFALTAIAPWLQRFIAWRLIAVTDSNQLAELMAQ